MKSNPTLKKLFDSDQNDRRTIMSKHPTTTWEKITERDKKRRESAHKLISEGRLKTGIDFYHASMIFQHGSEEKNYKVAQKLAYKSMKMGYKPAHWLYAATTDRLLLSQNKKQKFGTQYTRETVIKNGKQHNVMRLQPYDKRTSDTLRKRYNVPSLKELKSYETR